MSWQIWTKDFHEVVSIFKPFRHITDDTFASFLKRCIIKYFSRYVFNSLLSFNFNQNFIYEFLMQLKNFSKNQMLQMKLNKWTGKLDFGVNWVFGNCEMEYIRHSVNICLIIWILILNNLNEFHLKNLICQYHISKESWNSK